MATDLWDLTHQARRDLADDLRSLREDAWHAPSLCPEWDVQDVVAHLSAAASLGRAAWVRSIVLSGFRPAVHNERQLRRHRGDSPAGTLARFEEIVTACVAPTNDLAAYLGEVLVHGEDIRVPLGLSRAWNLDAATAVAEFYAARDFTVNSKTVVAGLHLAATDGPFSSGDGPEVVGSTRSLVMTMAGRRSHLHELQGDGVGLLTTRVG